MISADNIVKSYGGNVLFENVNFKLNPRERLGVVGRNGHGKTTLFRLIIGDDHPDSGNINIPKNYRIGYVRQHLDFTEQTVLEEGMRGLTGSDLNHSWKVEKVLAGLGFSHEDMQRPPEHFSGGYQVRLNLAKVLVSDPDLLLLDEPTNYLDITSIRWIEQFLLSWPHELMLITHDRSFMDAVVTHTMGIHRKKFRKIAGNTDKYYSQMAQEEEIYEKTRLNDERRRKEVELFITRFRAKARLANLVQSRIKLLEKMEPSQKLGKIKTLDFSFQNEPFTGKFVLDMDDISFGYDKGHPLISDLNITVRAGERVGVVGKNGKGKTTLLRLLAGQLSPHGGAINIRPGIVPGFFEQTNIQHLVDSRTVEEEILMSNPNIGQQITRNICGAMMFSGDDALKKVSILSGGEKSRVILGKLLVTPVNLLLLDEPTHHLDMDACDALLSAIDNFDGAVIIVTHNEMFLHALAERLIVFESDLPYVFEGSYQRFLEQNGWRDDENISASNRKAWQAGSKTKISKKEFRKRRSEIIYRRSKSVKPIERKISETEDEIEAQEIKLQDLNEAMQQATQRQDGALISEISQHIHHAQSAIDQHFEKLETLTLSLEQHRKKFNKKLLELENMLDTA